MNGTIIRMTRYTRRFYQMGAHGRLRVHQLQLQNASNPLSHLGGWNVLYNSSKQARHTASRPCMREYPSKALNIHWMIGNGRRPHNTNFFTFCKLHSKCCENFQQHSMHRDQFTLYTSSMVSHLEHTRKITRSGQRKNI